MSAVEWADEHFYLSSESSYTEGKWKTNSYQVAILNAMGNDDIRVVNWLKSARVGYTKLILACMGYMLQHKKRNQMLWQPTDKGAEEFTKQHLEPCLRDVPILRLLSPWLGQKNRDNTLDYKRFTNRKQIFIKGGTSAKNYAEKSVDTAYYDELSRFLEDIEKEGDALTIGDKRVEGAVYPKSIRGSSPKTLPECQITKAAQEAEYYFRRFVPCPHCKEEQTLVFGGKDFDHGFKFDYREPRKNKRIATSAYYVCKHCAAVINNNDLPWMDDRGRYKSEDGVWTKDGLSFFDEKDKLIDTPKTVAFHIWTIFSPFSPWLKIAQDFLDKEEHPLKLKSFINTTLGEPYVESGEKVDHNSLYMRREYYPKRVPEKVVFLVFTVDVQDDRLEMSVYGFSGSEIWLITHDVLRGDPGKPEIWKKLTQFRTQSFEHESGVKFRIGATGIDTGGHYTQQVYKYCKKHASENVYALKGSSTTGKPIVSRPSKSNSLNVDLYTVGTDTAKDLIFAWLKIQEPGVNYVHFPMGEPLVDEEFFEQLTGEKRETRYKNGFPVRIYVKTRSRNEALDCFVYALAALEIARPVFPALHKSLKQKLSKKQEQPKDPEKPTSTGTINKARKKARTRRKKSYVKGY